MTNRILANVPAVVGSNAEDVTPQTPFAGAHFGAPVPMRSALRIPWSCVGTDLSKCGLFIGRHFV